MRRFSILLTLLASFTVCFLSGCGSVQYYQHSKVPAPAGENLTEVTLRIGETVKMVKHTRGIAIGGGYMEGVVLEDPSLVKIRYGKSGGADRFDPLVSMTGVRQGSCWAIYSNRLGSKNYAELESYGGSKFRVKVLEP